MSKKKLSPIDYAHLFLSYRDRTWSELEKRMQEHDYTSEEIEEVKVQLIDAGYIDDSRFANEYIENIKKKTWGPLKTRVKLYSLGLSNSLIEETMSKIDWHELLQEAIEREKHRYSGDKLAQRLYRLGFPKSWIWNALANQEYEE